MACNTRLVYAATLVYDRYQTFVQYWSWLEVASALKRGMAYGFETLGVVYINPSPPSGLIITLTPEGVKNARFECVRSKKTFVVKDGLHSCY